MKVVKPPFELNQFVSISDFTIFLGGSIEGGSAEDWQSLVEKELKDMNATILNPRRDNWDNTWEQSIKNPNFKGQVDWELSAQERANVIVMYFDKNTKSPISLLELGLFAMTGKMVVYCQEGFWRKGNVDVVCNRYGVKQVNSFKELISEIKKKSNG